MTYAQPGICRGELAAQASLGFWDKNESSSLGLN